MSKPQPFRAYDEVITFFANGPSRDAIAHFQLSDESVERVRSLLLKKSAGTLTSDEIEELEQCSQLDRMITLIRSRARQQKQGNLGA